MSGREHRLSKGETLAGLAQAAGFASAEAIYNHPDNADFKRAHPNPNLLTIGDVIRIPDPQPGSASAPAEQKTRFRRKMIRQQLKLKLQDRWGNGLAGYQYLLELEDRSYDGELGDDGTLELEVSAGSAAGTLRVWPAEATHGKGLAFEVRLGGLQDAEVEGVQARLANLGFHVGSVDGDFASRSSRALRDFQSRSGEAPAGELSEGAKDALKEKHDA